jgi:mRNA-degrading endonuclease RelE of RelBE toxin-antitoxin system
MAWCVLYSRKAVKQIRRLPRPIQDVMLLLVRDLELNGPGLSGKWKHYSKLKGSGADLRHCHLVRGRPTYVCCWRVENRQLKILEIYYVGTHEKALY